MTLSECGDVAVLQRVFLNQTTRTPILLGKTWVFSGSGFGVIRQNICDLQWMEAFIPEAAHVREVGENDSTPAE
jgi:hypothetical protein